MAQVNETFKFLCKVPLFASLPEPDLRKICEATWDVDLVAGDILFKEGALGDNAYVVRRGEMDVLRSSTGSDVLLAVVGPGEVIGEMALVEEAPRNATLRARSDTRLLAIPKAEMDKLLDTSTSAARAMFTNVLQRWRTTESALRQNEKMAQLGTLSAGVAHELNNPAAAVSRASDQLSGGVRDLASAYSAVLALQLTDEQQAALDALSKDARERAVHPLELGSLERSDREYEVENWLEDRNVSDPWEVAPTLVNMGYDTAGLGEIAGSFGPDQLKPVVSFLSASYGVHNLINEIGQGSGRISEIVKALKGYAYLDQAPVQEVDVHEGLNDTLVILRSKLKDGITVKKEYAEDLPVIQAYGSELNQVWTNLIDNAAYAMDGKGEITISTDATEGGIQIDITDDGPGIPPEIQSRIFDAFFTTKPPGQGTGLGLDISHNIIVLKHRGELLLESEPGKTRVTVRLPLNFEAV